MDKKEKIELWLILTLIPLVEVALTIILTKLIGGILTYSIYFISTTIGLLLQWRRWKKVESLWEIVVHVKSKKNYFNLEFQMAWAEIYQYWFSTILILIPGLITDAIGFYNMLPPVKAKKLKEEKRKFKNIEKIKNNFLQKQGGTVDMKCDTEDCANLRVSGCIHCIDHWYSFEGYKQWKKINSNKISS